MPSNNDPFVEATKKAMKELYRRAGEWMEIEVKNSGASIILPKGISINSDPPGGIYSGILKKWIDPKTGEEIKK